jgi:hypothetical protein
MRNRIKKEKSNTIEIDAPCTNICILPNNCLVSVNYYDKSLILYNHEFKQIKKIDKINENQNFRPFNIELNNQNQQLYISDMTNNQIIVTDIDLNFIKTFGSKGSADDQFNVPAGICYKNDHFYVCD